MPPGGLKALKVGPPTIIPTSGIDDWLNSLSTKAA